jgi:hypothetical protein
MQYSLGMHHTVKYYHRFLKNLNLVTLCLMEPWKKLHIFQWIIL